MSLDQRPFRVAVEPVLAPHVASKDVAIAVDLMEGTLVALPVGWFEDAVAYLSALAESETIGELRERAPSVYQPVIQAWIDRIEDGEVDLREPVAGEPPSLLPPGGLRYLEQRARLSGEPEPDAISISSATPLEQLGFAQFTEDYLNLVLPPSMLQAGWLPTPLLEYFATLSMGIDGVLAHIRVEELDDLTQGFQELGLSVRDGQPLWESVVSRLDRVAARFGSARA